MNVLVVCHGNVCRSPLAARIMATILGGDHVRQGGFAKVNVRAAKKVREFAELLGYSLAYHRSRLVDSSDVFWADKVVLMSESNRARLEILVGWQNVLGDKFICLNIRDPSYLKQDDPKFLDIMNELVLKSVELAEELKGES